MKAAFYTQHGGPEVLTFGDLPDPPFPAPHEVRVRVRATAINRLDKWVRDGWPGLKLRLPHIPGADGAGVVEHVGAQVTQFAPGDQVAINANLGCGQCTACLAGQDNYCERWHLLGETTPGTMAEWVNVPARQLVPVPAAVPLETAAAAGLVYLTAWHSLITRGQLRPGETVLVVGAGGGVNTASIQIAKLAGASVWVIGSNAQKLALAQRLGADVLIDRSTGDWGKHVYTLSGKRGVDVVVDNVGAPTLMTSLRCARRGGRVLTVGNTGGPLVELDNRYIFGRQIALIGSTMGTLTDYRTVMSLVFAGRLTPAIDSVRPLSAIREAHDQLERGETHGKLVLTLPETHPLQSPSS